MLAIVIPYYKLTFFESTLQSIANQTDKRFKVYIGNDASPENPEQLLQKYQSSFNFDYQKFETNLGGISLVRQWERCMEMTADEEWIMILGDDDKLDESCVSEFYKCIDEVENNKISVIRFATIVINQKEDKISKEHLHPKTELSTDFLMRKLKGGTRSSLSEYIFKNKIVKEIGFKNLPLAWHSDDLAVLEFSKFSLIYTINTSFVYFRLSDFNITSKKDNLKLKNISSFKFYHYLLDKKKDCFNNDQKQVLYKKLEKNMLNDKKNVKLWLYFFVLHIQNRQINRIFHSLINATK